MSTGSQVAPGTPCAPCRAKGHFCAAREIVGARAVCLHCLDGVDCPRTPRNGAHGTVVAAPAKPVVKPKMVTVTVPASAAKVFEEHPVRLGVPMRVADPEPVAKPAPVATTVPVPRRHFPTALPDGLCSRGCGQPTHRGNCKGRLPADAFPKGAVHPVAHADEMVAKSKVIFRDLEAEHAVFSAPDAAALVERTEQMAKQSAGVAHLYEVVDLSAVPGRKPASAYAEDVAYLRTLPVNTPVKRTMANAGIAHTIMSGICRTARAAGMVVSSKLDGATMYIWRRAKAK